MAIYLRGLMMGLAYVAPIGTQNLFVINAAVTQPKKKAFLTALIITFFDISLSLACFFGVGGSMEFCLTGRASINPKSCHWWQAPAGTNIWN